MRGIRLLFLIIALLGMAGASYAQLAETRSEIEQQTSELSDLSSQLSQDRISMGEAQAELEEKIAAAEQMQKALRAQEENLTQRLGWLGDAAEGETSEVSTQRNQLQSELDTLQTMLGQLRTNISTIQRLETEISEYRRETRFNRLTERSDSLVEAETWSQIGRELSGLQTSSQRDFGAWMAHQDRKQSTFVLIAKIVGIVVLTGALTYWLRRWLEFQAGRLNRGWDRIEGQYTGPRLVAVLARTAPAIIAGFAMYQAILSFELVSVSMEPVLRTIWLGLAVASFVDSSARIFLTEQGAASSLAKLSPSNSRTLRFGMTLTALVIALDAAIASILHQFSNVETLQVLRAGTTAILLVGFILFLTRKSLWRTNLDEPDAEPIYVMNRQVFRFFRFSVRILTGFALLGVLLGFVNAAHALTTRICLIALAAFFLLFFRNFVRETIDLFFSAGRHADEPKETEATASSDADSSMAGVWSDMLVDSLLLLAALPILLLLAGFDWLDLSLIVREFADGFTIAGQRFSPMQILFGIFAFLVVMALTRALQRVTDNRLLSRIRVEDGVRNSLKTLIGYVGLGIAFMTAIGMVGFDLSNLAIIAGALSVGIGFGLQSIVNNFVSGLILLFERPIKVGDWIVTTSGEGIVKKISVRSTEIETFDRSSIIVPNSELISSSVTNWTHKNTLGRVTVPVGVAYKEDPDRIMEILQKIPEKVELVLEFPEPVVLFSGFGDSSINFEIRAFIADVSKSLAARTQLRVAIFKEFRDEGVEIPFPQRDLNFRAADDTFLTKVKPVIKSE